MNRNWPKILVSNIGKKDVERVKLLGGCGVIILSLTMFIVRSTSGKSFECQGQFFCTLLIQYVILTTILSKNLIALVSLTSFLFRNAP